MATPLGQFMQAQSMSRARNQARLNQATALYDSIIAQYSQGEKSPFMQSVNKQLEIGGRKAVAQGMQSLVSAGLSGTTVASGLGTRYEEEVGAPTRLNALDTMAQRLTSARMAKAGVLERVEDTVDTSQMANLMMAANSGGGDGRTSYGFGADAKVVSSSSYLQPPRSPNELYYGSTNPNAYNPYATKPTLSVRDGYSTKNLQASILTNKPASNIYYGSSNPKAMNYYYEPIKGKTSQGNVTQYIDW